MFFLTLLLIFNILVLFVSFISLYTLAIEHIKCTEDKYSTVFGGLLDYVYYLNFILLFDYGYCLNFILFLELFYLGILLFQIYNLKILILYILLLLILFLLLRCYNINSVCVLWDIKKQLLKRFSLFFFCFSFNLILYKYYFVFIFFYCLYFFFLYYLQNSKSELFLQKLLKISIPSILITKLVFFLIKNDITFSFLYEKYENFSFLVKNLLILFCFS